MIREREGTDGSEKFWKRVMDGDLKICLEIKREEKGTVRAVISYLLVC